MARGTDHSATSSAMAVSGAVFALRARAETMSDRAKAMADAVQRLRSDQPFPPTLLKADIIATLRDQACLWDAVSTLCEAVELLNEGRPLARVGH